MRLYVGVGVGVGVGMGLGVGMGVGVNMCACVCVRACGCMWVCVQVSTFTVCRANKIQNSALTHNYVEKAEKKKLQMSWMVTRSSSEEEPDSLSG